MCSLLRDQLYVLDPPVLQVAPPRPGEDLKAADQGGLQHAVAAHLLDLEGVAAEADQSPALAVVVLLTYW
jgi:hypothetical protein